jgi:hypothetical protein
MDRSCPDTAAEYHQQAKKIRALEAQISVLEVKLHLLKAAEHLKELADRTLGKAAILS